MFHIETIGFDVFVISRIILNDCTDLSHLYPFSVIALPKKTNPFISDIMLGLGGGLLIHCSPLLGASGMRGGEGI